MSFGREDGFVSRVYGDDVSNEGLELRAGGGAHRERGRLAEHRQLADLEIIYILILQNYVHSGTI